MIFILGGDGFIGSAFRRLCETQGLPHEVINRGNYDQLRNHTCDILVNANGNSKKFMAERHPVWEFDASVRSVRASLADFKYKTFVHLSSCDVYPDCSSPETSSEEQAVDVSKQTPYGFHKYLAEQCVRHVAKRWLIFRLGGFVGPSLKKNPIFDILQGGPLWLDPASEMQFLHTDELARIVLLLVDDGYQNEIFNISGNGLICLNEVIQLTQQPVLVNPCSPYTRCDVSLSKVSGILQLPDTRPTVEAFIHNELLRRPNPT